VAQLTDAGFAALAEAAPGHVSQVRRSLIDLLTPEQLAQLREISEAIIAAADRPVGPAAGILDCNAQTEPSSPGSREPERAASS
jgi:hypothetical protein